MSKPVSEWDEAYILSLPKENDEFDRKGSKALDLTLGDVNEAKVLVGLAKQLSAFANTHGGKIIYGLNDEGFIDNGGVSTRVKNGTREWLERVVAGLTEYGIVGVRVHEFERKGTDSKIAEGKAIYVIEIPDSDRAPHQSKQDLLYYVRLNSQSTPAPHWMIEDIRNRLNHPRVILASVTTESMKPSQPSENHKLYSLDIILRISLVNDGSLKSSDTFFSLNPEKGSFRFGFDKEVATGMFGIRGRASLWQMNRPIPPKSEISFRANYHLQAMRLFHPPTPHQWYESETETGERKPLDDVFIEWIIYADSAAPRTGRVTMNDIGLMEKLRLEQFR